MKILKMGILFCIGGGSYYALELLWRGRSHITMFVLGGLCFLLLGGLQMTQPRLPLAARLAMGCLICTAGELLFGLLFNRGYEIWDYRRQPLNWGGQICITFSVLWIPLSAAAMWLYERWDARLDRLIGRFA